MPNMCALWATWTQTNTAAFVLTSWVLLRAAKRHVKVAAEGVDWSAINNGQLHLCLQVSLHNTNMNGKCTSAR
jgi:hypothetical protein